MAEEVVVAGAGFAGVNTALELASRGYEVRLIDKNCDHEYTPGLINFFRERVSENRLKLDLEGFFEGTGVEFCNETIDGIDTERKTVSTDEDLHVYDYLVVTLGGDPRTFGIDVSDAYLPYGFGGAKEVTEQIEGSETVLIVGSGYVGVEVAGELAERGLDVTVVDQSTRPMPNSNEKSSHIVLDYFDEKDISFRGGSSVTQVNGGGVELESGDTLEADLVLWAGGVKAPDLVQKSFDCGPAGIDVNPGLSDSENAEVFAAGDSADTGCLKTAHNAMEQADILAENLDRADSETLKPYVEGTNPLVVSLGSTGMFIYGDRTYESRFFRYLKDLIRMRYWFLLREKQLGLKLRNLF